jgi:hypothetical protein
MGAPELVTKCRAAAERSTTLATTSQGMMSKTLRGSWHTKRAIPAVSHRFELSTNKSWKQQ